MAQLIGGAIGAYAGFLIGGPQGAQIGFALGSAAGGYLAAPDIEGPRLDDLKAPKVSYGAVIPYVEGHPPLPGVVVWSSAKREIANSTSAKGGPEATSFTYVIDALYTLASNDCGELRRVWLNGELVWTNADDSTIESREASEEAPWSRITLYRGGPDQLPDPTYEAAVGLGNAPAYRTRTTVFIQDLQLTGDQLPVLKFECGGIGTGEVGPPYMGYFNYPYGDDALDIVDPANNTSVLSDGGNATNEIVFLGENTLFDKPVSPPEAQSFYTHVSAQGLIFRNDYSQPTNYVFTLSAPIAYTQSGGFAAVVQVIQFRPRETSSGGISIGLWYIDDDTVQLVTAITDSGGGTASTFHDIYFPRGDGTKYKFLVSVPQTDNVNPVVPHSTIPNQLFVKNDVGGSPYENYVLLNTSLTGNYDFFSVGSGERRGPGNTYHGIRSFKVEKLIGYRGNIEPGDVSGIPFAVTTLQEVVERQCALAGIPAEYVDATDLASRNVAGMAITQVTSPRNVIDTLSRAYFFTAVESDVLRFKFLGGDIVETIPYEALGAALDTPSADPLPIVLANDLELPVQVYVKYINGDDDYQDGNEQSFRVTNSPGNTSAIELPLVFTPTEAKRIADVAVSLGKTTSQRFGPFSMTRDYAHLEPTDPVLLTDRDGSTYRARLTSKNEAQGVLTFEAVLDDATIINSAAETSGGYNNSTVVAPKLATEFEPLDIALLRDVDDTTGIYWAAGGAAGWPGAVWQQSADDTTFANISDTTRNTIIGVTVGTLANWAGGQFFDEATVLRVNIPYGTLASYTRDDVLNNGAGGYLVGSELIQARNATLVSAGVYDLTGLLRGRRGTEWAMTGHAANERFVVLSPDTLNRQPLNVSDIGSTVYWKAVTFGRLATTANSESLVFSSVSQRPFSPVDLRGARDSGDLAMTWRRRTRLSTNFHAHLYPLGEASEAYQVVVYADNAYAAVKRVIRTTSPTAPYSSADQTTDFGSPQATVYVDIFQISATAGRGYALRGAI